MFKKRLLYIMAAAALAAGSFSGAAAGTAFAEETAGAEETQPPEGAETDGSEGAETDASGTAGTEDPGAADAEAAEGEETPLTEEIGSGKVDNPEAEMQRLGTVSDGEHTIHLGDTREQVLSELGEPISTTLDDADVLNTTGILFLNDTFEGVTVYYRNYRRMEEDYQWMEAEASGEALLDDGRKDLVNVAVEGESGEETPDLRVVYIYLENGDYRTADGICCGDTAEKVRAVPTVFGESGIFEQNLYDGEYISWDTWNMLYTPLEDDVEASVRMMLDTRAVSIVMDPDTDLVQTIIVGDAFAIRYWN